MLQDVRVVPLHSELLVEGDHNAMLLRFPANDPNRILRVVDALIDPEEIDQRSPRLPRCFESPIVEVVWIGALPLVAKVHVGSQFVLIREVAGPTSIRGRDAQGRIEPAHHSDSSLSFQGN
jgi:hypothetical protein